MHRPRRDELWLDRFWVEYRPFSAFASVDWNREDDTYSEAIGRRSAECVSRAMSYLRILSPYNAIFQRTKLGTSGSD